MKITKTQIAVVIGIIGAVKYYKFKDFIDNLQLGLDVLKVSDTQASVAIKPLNVANIPYKFDNLGLLLDKENHLATTAAVGENLSVLPDLQNAINFNLLKAASRTDLSNSEIVVNYNFYGFEFTRLYKPLVQVVETGKTVVDYSSKASESTNKPCGCGCN